MSTTKLLAALSSLLFVIVTHAPTRQNTSLRFEVGLAAGLVSQPADGRLFVIIARSPTPEPRLSIGNTGFTTPSVVARDIPLFDSNKTGVIDGAAATFPIENLSQLPAGDYQVQALFDSNIDHHSVNAPGNLFSVVQQVRLDPRNGGTVKLTLTQKIPEEA